MQLFLKLKKTIKKKFNLIKPTYRTSLMKITKIAKHYDVNKILINDEYIWPYIRNDLTVAVTGKFDYAKRNVKVTPYLSQKGHIENLPIKYREEYKKLYGCIEIDELKKYDNIDYLFVTNLSSVEDVIVHDKIYKRLTDPLYESTLEYSNSLKIELIKFKTKNIENITKYYHPTINILPPVGENKNYTSTLEIDNLFIKNLKKYCPSLPITKEFIYELINWNLHSRNYWLEIFKKIQPKVVLSIGFHRAGPMISAAHELGIKSVDIQHGIQSGWNPIYNNWEEVPENGYQALPDYFAVWSKEDKVHISQIFKHKVSVIITSYLWLERQQEFLLQKPSKIFLKQCKRYNNVVLLTMQREKKVSIFIQNIIKENNQTLWLIRAHPKGKKFKREHFNNLENILLSDEINTMYVVNLLRHVNLHITEGSTMIKEVAHFTIPSLLINKKNEIYFINEIQNKLVYRAYTVKKVKKLIQKLSTNIDYNNNVIAKIDIKNILKKLILPEKKKDIIE